MNILIMMHSHESEADHRIIDISTWQPQNQKELDVYNNIINAISSGENIYFEEGYETANTIDESNVTKLELPCRIDKIVDCSITL